MSDHARHSCPGKVGARATSHRRWVWGLVTAAVWTWFVAPFPGLAQTTNITSSGLGTTVTQNGTIHDITGGTRRGANLFHGFGLFNVGTGDTANFLNDSGLATSNILGRINGGQRSSIFGTIQTTNFGSANLFLINPAGWIFGPTASLNVGGSFHVSTADYIRLSDGIRFNADGSNDPLLTSAPPAAFGFLGVNPPASISVNGSPLQVPEGQTLSLVGGNVQLTADADTGTPSSLLAPSGRVQIGSFASAGEATVDGLNGSFASLGQVGISGGTTITAADIEADPAFVNGGSILLRGGQVDIVGSSLNVSGLQSFDVDGNSFGTAGGTVVIRGGQLLIDVFSTITSQTFGNESGNPVGIDLKMDESVTVANGSSLLTSTSGLGRGGNIEVAAGDIPAGSGTIDLQSSASIVSLTTSPGRGGDLSLASGQVTVHNSTILTASVAGGGIGGNVLVDGVTVAITSGGTIQSQNQAGQDSQGNLLVGQGGDITLRGRESVLISGVSEFGTTSSVFTLTDTAGDGGQIHISAPSVIVESGAEITSQASFSASPGGTGGAINIDAGQFTLTGAASVKTLVSSIAPEIPAQGGNLTLNVTGLANLTGPNTGISTVGFGARPGDITADVGMLRVTNGATIQAGFFAGDSEGGNITLTASDSILIADGGGVSSQSFSLDVGQVDISANSLTIDSGFINTGTLGAGNAGDISINVGSLTLTRGGQIASSAIGQASGTGGDVTINANSVTISGSSPAPVLPEPFSDFIQDTSSGIFSTTSAFGSGGNINLQTTNLTISDGGTISANSSGTVATIGGAPGNAGNVSLLVSDTLRIDNGIITVATLGEGNAGNVLLNIGNLTQTGGARIESSTAGAGQGGNVTLAANGTVLISGVESGLFSTASSTGNAGQITVTAPTLAMNNGGTISVATQGDGAAGNVALNINELTLASGAQISSSTSGPGAGGILEVTAGELLSVSGTGSGLFSTASSTGNAGQITVSTPALTMADGGTISAATSGSGNAGNLFLNVGNLTQTGGARVDSSTTGDGHGGNITIAASGTVSISDQGSGLFSTASGTGAGGNVSVQAQNVSLLSGGTISANSTGTATATAGNIDIVVADTLRMENSSITTEALVADGGNISITSTGSLLHMTNSQIATSVQSGSGGGGNITIGSVLHPFDFLVLNNSGIHADAFGGPGGNINIFTDVLLSSVPLATAITASSALNTPGTIDIEATVTQLTSDVSQLPEAPLQATALLRATCAARIAAGRSSSLVLGGRGGLPLEPGGLLPSPLAFAGSAISFGHYDLANERLSYSPSSFSLLPQENNQRLSFAGWDQFQLARTAMGLSCGQ